MFTANLAGSSSSHLRPSTVDLHHTAHSREVSRSRLNLHIPEAGEGHESPEHRLHPNGKSGSICDMESGVPIPSAYLYRSSGSSHGSSQLSANGKKVNSAGGVAASEEDIECSLSTALYLATLALIVIGGFVLIILAGMGYFNRDWYGEAKRR